MLIKGEIRGKIRELIPFPLMYKAGRKPGTREMVIRSNQIVVYAVDAETVTVLRVLHAASKVALASLPDCHTLPLTPNNLGIP